MVREGDEAAIESESKTGASEKTTAAATWPNDQIVAANDEQDTFADAQPPSAKVEHDFVPGQITENPEESNANDPPEPKSELVPCPQCGTHLEPWQLACHSCGKIVCQNKPPFIVSVGADRRAIEESFTDWLNKGTEAQNAGRFGEAQNCFNEALMRARGLTDAKVQEVAVRKQLAKVLERLEKRTEASEQYMKLSKLAQRPQEEFEKRARDLSLSTTDVMSRISTGISYRAPEGKELKLAPLYCDNCRQLLVEAEVYGFRNHKAATVHCFCGADAAPVVRVDEKHFRSLKNNLQLRSRRAQLLQSAAQITNAGRTRGVAIAYAVLLGWLGAHRFYLGETAYGAVYFLWWLAPWLVYTSNAGHTLTFVMLIWSCIPWFLAVFEAIGYAQMSRVTFNLTYNIEAVVERLPAEEGELTAHDGLFVMDVGEGPDPEAEDESELVFESACDHKGLK